MLLLRTIGEWLKAYAPSIGALGSCALLCATYIALTAVSPVAAPASSFPPPTATSFPPSSTTTTAAPPSAGSSPTTTGPPVSGMQSTTTTTGIGIPQPGVALPLPPGVEPSPTTQPSPPREPPPVVTTTTLGEPPEPTTTTAPPAPTTEPPNNDHSKMPDPCVIEIDSGKPHNVPCHSTPAQREIIEAAGFRIVLRGEVIVSVTTG